MENALALVRDDAGFWRDQDGQVCNERGQRLDGEGNIIRTLGDYNRPEQFYANRSAICAPAFQRNDFELKPVYYTLVGQHPFHGLSHEHPMDHIERFEELVTSIKYTGVSNDFLFCKLSEELRLKISTFSQGPTEAFKAAWMRFKSYQRDCPHHGFSDVQLLGIFFRGVDWRYQMALDAASNGNFNTRYPEDAVVLIENLASSNSTKNADYQQKKLAGNMDGSQIAEVKAKLDSVHSLLVGKKSVRFPAKVQNFGPDETLEEEDVNFINGAGFQGQRFGTQQGNTNYNGNNQRSTFTGNQNSSGYNFKPQYQTSYSNNSFSRNYGSLPTQTPDNKVKSMLEQILEGQQKMTVDFNGKIDALYMDLNGKIEVLNTHVKKLDTQVAQTAESVKRQEGFLPGKTDTNPRHYCSAISLRSGKKLTPVLKKGISEDEIVELDESEENFETAEPVSSDTTTSVARHQSQSEAQVVQNPKPTEERVYKPKVPYPRNPRKSKQELDNARCNALMEKLVIEIPLVDAVKIAPTLRHYVKRMVTNNLSHEQGVMMISEQVSAVIQNKIPEKLSDPGSFVLDCSIFSERFKRSLSDLGSSVNLMPYSVAVNLGMTDFKPTKISLILADRSKRIPKGVLEDVPIKVGDCIIPTDFMVLEYGEEPKDPLILGRSFFATSGAVIDVKHGNLDLHLGDTIMTFKMEKLKDPTIDGQTFQVSAISEVIVGDQNVLDAEGNKSRPPKHRSHLSAIPVFLGRPHAHNAYTPPWMRRFSQRHSLPLCSRYEVKNFLPPIIAVISNMSLPLQHSCAAISDFAQKAPVKKNPNNSFVDGHVRILKCNEDIPKKTANLVV
ncbi:uncharacterized protein LOC112082144 [Eutrema salsugineum]|uniref:uncharacterized protein LOC112082144 n=1 Tax=Eutrema salsugineum TaxID=72664 RepID=UPI000CED3EB7|nr:uncharacterized protein LOC112082144 [Eutrema salsugineum]